MRKKPRIEESKPSGMDHEFAAARYRDAIVAQWRRQQPDFVESQSFLRLVPDVNGKVMRYLHPRWFLPGKKRSEGKTNWEPLSREELLAAAQDPERPGSFPTPLRVAIIAGGGAGKSTNMEWLEARLNTDRVWAILLRRGDLAKDGDMISALVRRVMSVVSGIEKDDVASQLGDLGRDGRLIILIDHLDQVRVTDEAFTFLLESLASWRKCGFVLAGRPSAFQAWGDSADSDTIYAPDWQFIEPAAFTDAQGEQFVDRGGVSRYHLAKRQLGPHCSVPRILQFLRQLSTEEIQDLRTPAELYDRVVHKLLAREKTVVERHGHAVFDTDRASCLLSALAFVSWNGTRTDEDFVSLTLNRDVRKEVVDRIRSAFPGYTDDQRRDDQRILTRMVLLISDASPEPDDNATIEWSSRTIVEFLASQWLACYAGDFVGSSGERPDITSLAVFYPEDAEYITYELNQFVADFPVDRLTPSSWLACVRRWYDPGTRENHTQRRWSTEMLYRSWRTMHAIARRPVHDWWNAPYDRVAVATTPVLGTEDRGVRAQIRCDPAIAQRAGEVLDAFFGDLQRLLEEDDDEVRSAAQEMIAESSWCPVPTGDLYMGAPPGRQGFPGKLEHFWRRELGKVQIGWTHEELYPVADGKPPRFRQSRDGEDVAQRAAEWLTKKEWFAGLSGEQLRKDDVKWLTNVLAAIGRRDAVDVKAPDYEAAYEKIERKWRKRDEVPLDADPQHVVAFTIQRFPILHRWFWLFARGHRTSVEKYLRDLDGTPHPPEDHPVIYVNWFDAWAFCQWATWRVPSRPGHVYKLRLPHEPEWEYAVRWCVQDGQVIQTPKVERYWWGDSFYANEEIPEDVTPKKALQSFAHVKGKPGATGAPKDLTPNGLGLYDTLGNVWEWMANLYDIRSEDEIVDAEAHAVQSGRGMAPIGYSRFAPRPDQRPLINALRSMRGGLWYFLDLLATCTSRFRLAADDDRDYKMGFRVVREEWHEGVRCQEPAKACDDETLALPPAPLSTVVVTTRTATVPAPSLATDHRHTILFLAANPRGGKRLALGSEAKRIREQLKGSLSPGFDFVDRWDAEPLDLLHGLRDLRPTIVHFSGHGRRGAHDDRVDRSAPRRDLGIPGGRDGVRGHGLILQTSDGDQKFVPAGALAQTLGAAGASVKLVVLSACYSEEVATALVDHVPCVVGMGGAILDAAAINFAIGFYGGLGAAQSVAAAYRQGRAAIAIELVGQDQPVLKVRADVDAEQLFFTTRRS